MRRLVSLILIGLFAAAALMPARALAQVDAVPFNSDASLVFDQGVEAFEDGEYGMAYRRFRLVYSSYPLNTRTTAAQLMAGKSLFREGRYEDAIQVLEQLIERYPTSSYVQDARETIEHARAALDDQDSAPRPFLLGITLPLEAGEAALTQAMFNGIRLAVDEHNDRFAGERPVRMVFRDSEGTEDGARRAAVALIDAGVDAIVGPLYSEGAEAAGEIAERSEIVLIAPLATEESVSQGRRHVFQANPTWTVRGQMLARFARERFGHERYGIFAEFGDSYSERMAEGFQDEVTRLDGSVLHYRLIESGSQWYQLDALLPATSWDSLEAVYLPISGQDAGQYASAALSALARAGVQPQVLGSAEWGNVTALSLASDFNTVYTNSFYLLDGDPAVTRFNEAYRELSGAAPTGQAGRVAYAGYDVARFLLMRMMQAGDAPLVESIAQAPWYQGLGSRLHFEGGNVNRGLYYMRYRPGKIDLLR
ncbi:MAG TPA: ABC transporter substrate-binding protein [Rhodothermales bacterium]